MKLTFPDLDFRGWDAEANEKEVDTVMMAKKEESEENQYDHSNFHQHYHKFIFSKHDAALVFV